MSDNAITSKQRVAERANAMKAIEKKLSLNEGERPRVADAVAELYLAWTEDPDRPPTLDALAAKFPDDEELAERIRAIEPDPFLKRRNTAAIATSCLAAVLIAGLGIGMAWNAGVFDAPEQPAIEQKENKAAEEPVKATAENVKELVAGLTFDGDDVGLDGGIEVVIEDGRIMVVHTVKDLSDAKAVLDGAAKRAAALANALEGYDAADVTWVVKDEAGDVHVAITEKPGDAPATRGTEGILEGSEGYEISDDVYEGIGGEESGIPQTGGTKPTDPSGEEIATKPADDGGKGESESEKQDDGDKQDQSAGGSDNAGNNAGGASSSQPSGSASQGGATGSSGGQANTPSQPSHTHNWQAHYATRQVWVPNQQIIRHEQCICSACGAVFSSKNDFYAHSDAMWAQGEDHGAYIDNSYDEVVDNGYYSTEQYIDYYYCSCGATK